MSHLVELYHDPEKWSQNAYSMFEKSRDLNRAEKMSAYMRNQFPFFGISAEERRNLQKNVFMQLGAPGKPLNEDIVQLVWDWNEREGQYFAMEILWNYRNEKDKKRIYFIEALIQSKSWWDTIDVLAPQLAAAYFKIFPNTKTDILLAWNQSSNMWLQRSSIVAQLLDKKQMNIELMSTCILNHQHSKEFFIQKAMGWLLRSYARTNPDFVRKFTFSHALPALTIREASKYL